jgi:hypothetical protein
MATAQDHFDASRKFQAYYDETLRKIGMRAPQPTLGDTVNHYRRETLRTIKRTFLPRVPPDVPLHAASEPVHPMTKVNFRGLAADALAIFEPQLLKACLEEAESPAHLKPGEIRKIERLDETGRVKFIDWVGRESFVRAMGRPGRRVISFTTDRGRFDASGRPLR